MTKSLESLLSPPSLSDVNTALQQFAQAVRARYGTTVSRLIVFGSRARGDHRPDSDVDVAVIFEDLPPTAGSLIMELGHLAYDPLVDCGVEIAPIPLNGKELAGREATTRPDLVAAIRRDGVEIMLP